MTAAIPSAKVILFPEKTVEERAAIVRAYLSSKEPQLKITTIREALSYGDQWQAYAHRMELALALVTAQRDASNTLLRIAEEQLARMGKVLGDY